jgi:hypothetical protein
MGMNRRTHIAQVDVQALAWAFLVPKLKGGDESGIGYVFDSK